MERFEELLMKEDDQSSQGMCNLMLKHLYGKTDDLNDVIKKVPEQ